jgi:hypothetical protein
VSDLSNSTPRKFRWQYLLVITIVGGVVVLLFLAVGKRGPDPPRQRTLMHLKLLDAMMGDFLAEGNLEPKPPSPWIYGGPGKPTPPAYAETSPASDPVHWLVAMGSTPDGSKRLDKFEFDNDKLVSKRSGYTAVNRVLLDEWGTPVRYVPSDPRTGKRGYFMSAGPDGIFSMMVPASSPPKRADELFSTDPG